MLSKIDKVEANLKESINRIDSKIDKTNVNLTKLIEEKSKAGTLIKYASTVVVLYTSTQIIIQLVKYLV